MARFFGDNTAEKLGRLTLNPIPHIDPMGLLMVVFVGFGFARPVPTDPRNYNSRWGIFFVAAAGPLMNLCIAFFVVNLHGLGVYMEWPFFSNAISRDFFWFLGTINMLLMLFNLIPIAPLDGHYILPYFLPAKIARIFIYYNQRYGQWVLLSLIALAIMGVPIFRDIWELGQSLLLLLYLW